ncbi:hypothetical protein PYW07_007765 [Mythimna separata]|uniref:Uncharacterized protein n=1 Tax=Mythimna separata TaxID=271217 RepID=A0AAD8DV30_MYTSE|nr:hypothetical protein PYW07_007765 [Mythimna separata]
MTYNNSVLVGNWAEERLKNEYEFKLFLRKRERRELLLQKSRTLFSHLLKEKSLAISGTYVLYGFNVQVVASDMPAKPKVAGAKQKYGLAMSILVRERQAPPLYVRYAPASAPEPKDRMPLRLSAVRDSNCRFTTMPLLPCDRLEGLGSPVKTSARLIIKNLVADKCLCVMNQNWMQTFFGAECGVNCANYIDIHGRNTAENVFTLVSDVETKTKY